MKGVKRKAVNQNQTILDRFFTQGAPKRARY